MKINMKINWKVRLNNPYFWGGLILMIFTAAGINPETLTSWVAAKEQLLSVAGNPYLLGYIVVTLIGYVTDFTTKGIGDSAEVQEYNVPKE